MNVIMICKTYIQARLAQSVERETLNLNVVGSTPTLGVIFFAVLFHMHLLYTRIFDATILLY